MEQPINQSVITLKGSGCGKRKKHYLDLHWRFSHDVNFLYDVNFLPLQCKSVTFRGRGQKIDDVVKHLHRLQ